MANQEQLALLRRGIEGWNQWRNEHAARQLDLSGADLSHAHLSQANLKGADLNGADLSGADLYRANLSLAHLSEANLTEAILFGADLSRAKLSEATLSRAQLSEAKLFGADLSEADLWGATLGRADLWGANLSEADLRRANLSEASLSGADLYRANLTGANLTRADLSLAILRGADLNQADLSQAILCEADLRGATLVGTNLSGATLTGCSIHGIFVWNVQLEGATQDNLVITQESEPTITIDQLEVAQFISLLLNSPTIRDVINTIGQKGVLILGSFSQERKPVLEALREKLRTLNFLPIVFDFERSTERDFTETIMTLAGLSCFIIADITNPKSSPLELQVTVPNFMIPFVPIIQEGEQPFAMFRDLKGKYDWVLDLLEYDTSSNLIRGLEGAVIKPALEKRDELLATKVQQLLLRMP
jgi:uncharacterized protein YjbI with pentapeptide repeats